MIELQAGTIAPEIGTIVEYGINEIMKEPRRYRVSAMDPRSTSTRV